MSLLLLLLFMLGWLGAGVLVTYLLFEPMSDPFEDDAR